MLEKIVSGGQTGVDRAALDVALERSMPCGGWCPKGRLAERWCHSHGCGQWFNVLRDTVTHEIVSVYRMGEPRPE